MLTRSILCTAACDSIETHQRLDVALHRVVVTTEVGHEAKAGQDNVIIVRLAEVKEHNMVSWIIHSFIHISFITGRGVRCAFTYWS